MMNKMQRTVMRALDKEGVLVACCPRRSGKSWLIRELNRKYNVLYYNGLAEDRKLKRTGIGKSKLLVVEEPEVSSPSCLERFEKLGYKILVIGSPSNTLRGLYNKAKEKGWGTLVISLGDLARDLYEDSSIHRKESVYAVDIKTGHLLN